MKFKLDLKIQTAVEINGKRVNAIDQVTMVGLESVASCLGSPHTFPWPWMPFIGLGQGKTPVSSEDTHLDREIFRKYGDVFASGLSYRVRAVFTNTPEVLEPGEDYILREVGIFDELAGGKMAVRWLLEDDIYVWTAETEPTDITGIDCTCIVWVTS
jgi:hypothetical protein